MKAFGVTLFDAVEGALELQLEFEAMTTDPEPLVVGRLERARLPAGGTVRAIREGGTWRTGPVPVDPQGRFALELPVTS